jgi:cell division protein FtsI/penicillin-binding protein 2
LALEMGISGLHEVYESFGLTAVPDLPLNTETPPVQPLTNPTLAGIGQENLVLTPLQLALAWSVLAADGRQLTPRLVTAVADESGTLRPLSPPAANEPIISAGTAQALRQVLTANGRVEFSDRVLSGPAGNMNSWYLGLAPAANPRYLAVVVLEGRTAVQEAEQVGQALLQTAVK